MSTFFESMGVSIRGHIKIIDETTGEVLLDKTNDIHAQNMARIIARKLANEDNSVFHKLAFGDGGTFIDAGLNINTRKPNDGNNGAGWEARLYHEIYSEVIDNLDPNFGTDPGSAGPDNVRVGGNANPLGDPSGLGVSSEENGKISDVIINMTINESEPENQEEFIFDEIGIYSSGLAAIDTAGFSSINVGTNKTSTSDISPTLTPSTIFTVRVEIDGITRDVEILTPASGTGTNGTFTYGDLCEGLNTGSWVRIGSPFNFAFSNGAFFFITDLTGGAYPSITGQDSSGLLTVQSKTTGTSSSIFFPEITPIPITLEPNLIFTLVDELWSRANVNQIIGQNAGLINDPLTTENERERLLTHLIFEPISKSASSIIRVIYTVTIDVSACDVGAGSEVEVPTPTPTTTITPTPTITPTNTITPTITPTITITPSATPLGVARGLFGFQTFNNASIDDSINGCVIDGTTAYLCGGTTTVNGQQATLHTMNITTGALLSSFVIGGTATGVFEGIIKLGSFLYVVGSMSNGADEDAIIFKFTLAGSIVWQRAFNTTNIAGLDRFTSIAHKNEAGTDYFYVAGFTRGLNGDSKDGIITKYDDSGTLEWSFGDHFASNKNIFYRGIRNYDDEIVLSGAREQTGSNANHATVGTVDTAGTITESYQISGAGATELYDLYHDATDSYLVGENDGDAIITKISKSTGTIGWTTKLPLGAGSAIFYSIEPINGDAQLTVVGRFDQQGVIAVVDKATGNQVGDVRTINYDEGDHLTVFKDHCMVGNTFHAFGETEPESGLPEIASSCFFTAENLGDDIIGPAISLTHYEAETGPVLSTVVLSSGSLGRFTFVSIGTHFTPTFTISTLTPLSEQTTQFLTPF